MSDLNDPRRLIGNLMRLGTIDSLDLAQGTVRVRVGDLLTGDIPFAAPRAGAVRIWSPPSVGEQVLLFCPEGDVEAGIILGALFSDAHPAPASDTSCLIDFPDGTRLIYDGQRHKLTIAIGAGGSAEISAPGGLTLNTDVTLNGKLDATGKITSASDVVAAGKSLTGHKHLQVQPGGGVSGAPQ
ncbi:phage baseplate assembly protein V [Sphingomonas sp. R1]|uniref:phage baseplate assembly protein V n=1 Tax=Sphingomonas sp. R1 TaxID=399176 RepID=UPI0022258C78|nr:phage baseplate assembly protein V [Sphingomonas sp. R1]UYY78412.1 phage baseplate assembly protein V [Sphingomonas sp. R1]